MNMPNLFRTKATHLLQTNLEVLQLRSKLRTVFRIATFVLPFLYFKEFIDRFRCLEFWFPIPPQTPYLLIITLKLSPFYHALFFAIQRNQK
jgi:hypothetical protein